MPVTECCFILQFIIILLRFVETSPPIIITLYLLRNIDFQTFPFAMLHYRTTFSHFLVLAAGFSPFFYEKSISKFKKSRGGYSNCVSSLISWSLLSRKSSSSVSSGVSRYLRVYSSLTSRLFFSKFNSLFARPTKSGRFVRNVLAAVSL